MTARPSLILGRQFTCHPEVRKPERYGFQTDVKPTIAILGKLAMADIFILAMYVVVAKGIGIGEIEVAWGLYLFTGCVILSLLLSIKGTTGTDAQ